MRFDSAIPIRDAVSVARRIAFEVERFGAGVADRVTLDDANAEALDRLSGGSANVLILLCDGIGFAVFEEQLGEVAAAREG